MLPPTTVEEQKPKPARKRQRKAATNSKNKKANASPAPTNAGFPSNPMSSNVRVRAACVSRVAITSRLCS